MKENSSLSGPGTRDVLINRTIKRLRQSGKRSEAEKLEKSLNAPTVAELREEVEKLRSR